MHTVYSRKYANKVLKRLMETKQMMHMTIIVIVIILGTTVITRLGSQHMVHHAM